MNSYTPPTLIITPKLKPTREEIPNLGPRWLQPSLKYDYEKNAAICPVCGGYGIPWGGWFNCQCCTAVALVEGGEVFTVDEHPTAGLRE